MSRRDLLGGLAVALAALGLLARSGSLLPPGLAATLEAAGRAATPGVALVLALGTAVGAALLVRGRSGTAPSDPVAAFRASPAPDDDLPLLGADIAAALDRIDERGPGADPEDRETVRAAVERAGVTVLARAEGIDRESARRRFRRGDWTRDPRVAAFCGAEVTVPFRTRLRETLAPESRFVGRTRRTVDALAGVAAGTGGRRAGIPETEGATPAGAAEATDASTAGASGAARQGGGQR